MRLLRDIKKTAFKKNFSCLKRTVYKDEKSKCDSQDWYRKLNDVVCHYWNSLNPKGNAIDLKLTEQQMLLAKRGYLVSYIDIFFQQSAVLDETPAYN